MEIIPAIDLKGGKCVRLRQGCDDATTEYSSDPVAVAAEWVKQGARRIHLVNLDGAFGRASNNLEIVRRIAVEIDAAVQFGGGLRSRQDVEIAFETGVDSIVLGTAAIENEAFLIQVLKDFGPERVIVALDAVRGKVATHGWQSVLALNLTDAALRMKDAGVSQILYTDIERDGMLTGPDYDRVIQLASLGLRVIVSGGISSSMEVMKFVQMNTDCVSGVIIGKALYERCIILPDLIAEVRQATAGRNERC